ncbi:MAG TPA: DnaJ domain-containing protein [Candidatus Binataceae bacterium]|jgi:DnaJ-class molecular chaperone|nr:DnaJ domain-containing protein [Candidatus Binataceae bacterium]
MPDRSLYAILGVADDADDDEIRRAYRQAAFAAHPDVGPHADPERFREIHEAYEVLRDPARRRAYDRRRLEAAQRAEPRFAASRRPPAPLTDITDASPPVLRLEAVLSPHEALFGCRVPFDLPITTHCPRCGGRDGWCPECGGSGIVDKLSLVLNIPAGIGSGRLLEFDLRDLGVPLRLLVRVVVL